MRALLLSAVFAVVISASAPALADEPRSSDPEVLFNEGLALMAEGKFEPALERLEEAQRRDPGIGTELNIAICDEQLGRLAEAWRHYTNVVRLSHAVGKTQREETTRQRLVALEARLSRLTLTAAAPAGLTVRVDGSVIPATEWGFVPLDGGEHRIEAEAAARKPWSTTLSAPPPGETARVAIPELSPLEAPRVVTVTRETTNGRRTAALVLGGIGAVGVVTAVVTGVILLGDKASADESCKPVCTSQAAVDDVNEGRALLPINGISWGIAAVGLGVGAFLFLTSRRPIASASGFAVAF